MLEQLIEKHNEWNAARISEFYNNLPVSNPAAWEWSDNGVYIITADEVQFHNFYTGDIFQISKKFNPNDWDYFRELFLISEDKKTFLMDVPVSRELMTINDTTFEYLQYSRPRGGTVGTRIINSIDLESSFTTLATEFYEYLSAIKTVATNHNIGFPDVYITHRVKLTSGYCWSKYSGQWTKQLSSVINSNLLAVEKMSSVVYKDPNQSVALVDECRALWQQLLD